MKKEGAKHYTLPETPTYWNESPAEAVRRALEQQEGVAFKIWVNTSSLTEGEYVTSRGERTRVQYHVALPEENQVRVHTFNWVTGVPGAIWITMETARTHG